MLYLKEILKLRSGSMSSMGILQQPTGWARFATWSVLVDYASVGLRASVLVRARAEHSRCRLCSAMTRILEPEPPICILYPTESGSSFQRLPAWFQADSRHSPEQTLALRADRLPRQSQTTA